MIRLEVDAARIFVRPGATDMRKQINGLALLVQEQMQLSPFELGLFVFCNGQRRILKALYWDRTGYCLWMKRLEKQQMILENRLQQVLAARSIRALIGLQKRELGLHRGELPT